MKHESHRIHARRARQRPAGAVLAAPGSRCACGARCAGCGGAAGPGRRHRRRGPCGGRPAAVRRPGARRARPRPLCADDKQAFFAATSRPAICDRLAEPPPGQRRGHRRAGSFLVVAELGLDATESFVPRARPAAGDRQRRRPGDRMLPQRAWPHGTVARLRSASSTRLSACSAASIPAMHCIPARFCSHPPADWSTPLKMAPLVASALLLFPDPDAITV